LSELQTVSTTIGILAACVSVVIGVVNQILSNRRAEEQRAETQKTQLLTLETRQAQLFMQIYNRWTSRDLIKAYGLVRYQYTDWKTFPELWQQCNPATEPEKYADHMLLHAFYEGVGVLVQRGLIDVGLVEDLLADRVMWHYERYANSFKEARIMTGDQKQYDSIEYLYNLMKQRQQQAAMSI